MGSPENLIAPFQTGLDIDTEPWQSPADSFSEANNVHIRNGYIEKRSGFRKFGQMTTFSVPINIINITNAALGIVETAVAHLLTTNDIIYITGVGGMTEVNNRFFIATVLTPTTFEITADTTLYGVYTVGGSVYTVIDSTDRVMGISQFISDSSQKITIAFNTTKANRFDDNLGFLPLDTTAIMSGTEEDYIWATNLQSASVVNRLYFTNGLPLTGGLNGIRYYEGANTTTSFVPDLGGGRTLIGCQLLFSLHERLIALNTTESVGGGTVFPQRARWCKAQSPSTWNDLTPGGGGAVDAPTGGHIITGKYLGDQIIVFFTDSVWALQPISDPMLPFKWTKLNDFAATSGRMASVGYDKYVVSAGVNGIYATDGASTEKIDARIKNFIVTNANLDWFAKIHCDRSYNDMRTWMLYPSVESDENNAALILDEETRAFTTYTISENCLGHGNWSLDLTLADFVAFYDLDLTIEEFDEERIYSFFWQGNQDLLLGGTITGQVDILEAEGTDLATEIESTLVTAGWNPGISEGKESMFTMLDIYVDTDEKTVARIDFYKDDDISPYNSQWIDFLPNLGYISSIQTISQASPAVINSASHGLQDDEIIYIYGVEGMEEINGGPYQVTVVDENFFTIPIDSTLFGAFTSGGSLYHKEFYKTKTWKRAYPDGTGYLHWVKITCGGTNRPMRISAFKPVFKIRGRRVVN